MLGLVEFALAAPSVEQGRVVAERQWEPGLQLLDKLLGGDDVASLGEGLEEGKKEGGLVVIGAGGEQ